jgi:hypothetical protein
MFRIDLEIALGFIFWVRSHREPQEKTKRVCSSPCRIELGLCIERWEF